MSDKKENAVVNNTRAIFAKAGITKPSTPQTDQAISQPTQPEWKQVTNKGVISTPATTGFNPANIFASKGLVEPTAPNIDVQRIPTRDETEFKALSPMQFILQELKSKFSFDENL